MKKYWNTIKTVLTAVLVLFTLCTVVFTIISLRTVNARQRSIFGYRMMIVQSNSMAKTHFDAGDLIFVKNVDPATLKEGDVIAFLSRNSHNYGETVTHRIRTVVTDASGEPGFVTYGTYTDQDDEAVVGYRDVLGIYTGRIQKLGTFFAFLKTPKGYISIILIPLLLMIFYSLFNCIRLFAGAQKEADSAYKAAMEDERRKNEQMRQELEELRAIIAANTAAGVLKAAEKPIVSPADPNADAVSQEDTIAPEKAAEVSAPPRVSFQSALPKLPSLTARKTGKFASSREAKNVPVPPQPAAARLKPIADPKELDLEKIIADYGPHRK